MTKLIGNLISHTNNLSSKKENKLKCFDAW